MVSRQSLVFSNMDSDVRRRSSMGKGVFVVNEESEKICGKCSPKGLFKLYTFEQIPEYLKDNEYILNGYRAFYTYYESWWSIFRIHNETGNIWSHLMGALLFTAYFVALLSGNLLPKTASLSDYFVFGGFILSAIKCFVFSSLYHTHICHSQQAFIFFGCLDYAGISFLISGSTFLSTFYLFHCHPVLSPVYLCTILAMTGIGILAPSLRVWSTPEFIVWRTLTYIISGIISGAPIIHYVLFYNVQELKGLWGLVSMSILYMTGALIYLFRIPERFSPGSFDIILPSHQIWHALVVAAAFIHLKGNLELLEWRLETKCPLIFI